MVKILNCLSSLNSSLRHFFPWCFASGPNQASSSSSKREVPVDHNSSLAGFDAKKHSPHLDGIRFTAFFLVFLAHTPRGMGIDSLQSIGWIGVDLFFVLSAYLLTSIMIVEVEKTGEVNLKNFFVRRCLRIWPLYFIAIILGFFVFPYLGIELGPIFHTTEYSQLLVHLKYFVAFTQNISTGLSKVQTGNMLGPLWSIATEEQFYLIFPFLMLWFSHNKFNVRFVTKVALSMICTTLLLKYILAKTFNDMLFSYLNLPTRLEPFAIGILIAVLSRKLKIKNFFIGFLPILMILPLVMLWSTRSWPHPTSKDSNIFNYLVNALAFGLLIVCSNVHNSLPNRIFRSKILSSLGKYTYGLYVWHAAIIYGCLKVEILNQNKYLLFTISLSLTILISRCSYLLFEKRFLGLKDKFR